MKKIKESIFFIFGAILVTNCFAQVDINRKAEMAGAFVGAIVMADEFKKSQCGKLISIDKKYTDVEYNKRQVAKSFPSELRKELLEFFNSQFISNQRMKYRDLYAQIPFSKCQQFIDTVFWFKFDDAVQAWDKVK
jgi:hypothetical protein